MVLAHFQSDSTHQGGRGSLYLTTRLKVEEIPEVDSKPSLIGCLGALVGGVVGMLIAGLVLWLYVQGLPDRPPVPAIFPQGKEADFLFGLLLVAPFGFVVGSVMGAVIAALGPRSSGTHKRIAGQPASQNDSVPDSRRSHSRYGEDECRSHFGLDAPTLVSAKGGWPRKSVLAAFSLIPVGFLLWFGGLSVGLGGGEQRIVAIATYCFVAGLPIAAAGFLWLVMIAISDFLNR